MAENQTQFDSSNLLGGESVYFNYEATSNACDQLLKIAKDFSERLSQIRSIMDQKDSIWKGPAGDRFWEEFSAKGKEYSIEEMEDIANTKMPNAISAVLDLIRLNAETDNELMNQQFTIAQADDSVKSIGATTDAYGVNQEGNNQVHANDNIHEKEATTSAQGVDTTLDDQVHANDSIHEKEATTNAQGVDTVIIDDTHADRKIQSVDSDVKANGIDTDLYNKVGTSGAFGGNNSADTSEASQASGDFNNALGAL